jgi:BirA family biotin operon repressor/biotin-[acetyl-CoA-carboxylase] ligase
MSANDAVKITTAAASAVADAIEAVSRTSPDIKWVNDIYIGGKKVCGILTEAAFSLENGGLEYAVLGIGVNAYDPKDGFPEEIKDIAGSVFFCREGDQRNMLAAEIISRFMEYYGEIETGSYMESYRDRLIWRGERINVISGGKETPATLIDVDGDCRLLVKYDDGTEAAVASGEISIRKA